jgi:transcriptional regulator with XRE-family HTH domain
MKVFERLIAWRTAANLSRREAARRAGIAQPTWSDLEGGKARRVSVDTALAIEKITGGAIRVTEWGGVSGLADESGSLPAVTDANAILKPSDTGTG